jgi:hypothetical protein
MEFEFNGKFPDGEVKLTGPDLQEFAEAIGLARLAPGRLSWVFVTKIYVIARLNGLDPAFIVDQVRALEGEGSHRGMKPATQFKHPPLAGLYHQHFFAPQFLAQNMLVQLGKKGIDRFVHEAFVEGDFPTEDKIADLARKLTFDQYEARYEQQKLTGEWIVFAKHEGKNYYLTVSRHTDPKKPEEDQALFREIEYYCYRQFPFLAAGS